MNGGGVHRGGTFVLSIAMLAIGIVLFVQSLANHASALSGRMLISILFVAAGALRLWVEVRKRRQT